jgi:MFS family permease
MIEEAPALEGTQKLSKVAMTRSDKLVVFASSLGTVFEWYDFLLVGALATEISRHFFSGVNPAAAFIFTLLSFAAGFAVRPLGAVVFGRLGDLVGRKYTFVVTIVLMGFATFAIGLLPGFASIGIAAPVVFVALRMLQGLAIGGEYGGAVIYVAEHAPDGHRGSWTSWIQTTGSLALLMSLGVVLFARYALGEAAFADWGWRIPFLFSIVLLLISVWIRLKLNESPAFLRMKAQGRTSKAPLSEAFGQWRNLKLILIAFFGLAMGQAVIWYTGQFYSLFFLTQILKTDSVTANWLIIIATLFVLNRLTAMARKRSSLARRILDYAPTTVAKNGKWIAAAALILVVGLVGGLAVWHFRQLPAPSPRYIRPACCALREGPHRAAAVVDAGRGWHPPAHGLWDCCSRAAIG